MEHPDRAGAPIQTHLWQAPDTSNEVLLMKIITANRLSDGVVVYRNPENEWIRDVRFAALFDVDLVEDAVASAKRDIVSNIVVGVEAIDARVLDGVEPTRLRERIRAFGPTIDYRATGRKSAALRKAA